MPTSINGIGTHYYGKRNLASRFGRCEGCGAEGELESYDTTLFVVLLYIPIIPLGKKRVLDQCPRCSRHRAMPAAHFQDAVTRVLQEREADEQADPSNVEKALARSAALLELGQKEETLAHLQLLSEQRFANDLSVLLHACAAYEQLGENERADRCLDRAFALAPDDPVVRRGRAVQLIERGDLAGAGNLLESTEEEHVDPPVLFMLGRALAEQGNHQAALQVLQTLLQRFPEAAQSKELRRTIKQCERNLRTGSASILPPRQLPWPRIMAAAAVVLLLIGGVVGASLYRRARSPVYLVNGCPQPLTVVVDSGIEHSFAGPGRTKIALATGRHRVEVSGAIDESFELSVADPGFWGSLFGDRPVMVVNPGGMAVLILEETIYSTRPLTDFDDNTRVHAGQRSQSFNGVDYEFQEFPGTISLDSSRSGIIKHRLDVLAGEPEQLYPAFQQIGSFTDCTLYLESWLQVAPRESLASLYAMAALAAGEAEHAQAVLRNRLQLDPVNVEWHRAYQTLGERNDSSLAELVAEYDGYLANDPDSSDLLYLRGRIEPQPDAAARFFRQAIRVDPKNLYPYRASAYQYLGLGRFGEAERLLEQVVAAAPDDELSRDLYHQSLFAGGKLTRLEADLRRHLESDGEPIWSRMSTLLHVLVAAGRSDEATALVEQTRSSDGEANEALAAWLQLRLLLATGQIEQLARYLETEQLPQDWEGQAELWVAFSKGDVAACNRAVSQLHEPFERGYSALLLSLLHSRLGNRSLADEWLAEGVKGVGTRDSSYRRFAALMQGEGALRREQIDELAVEPGPKAVMLALLATRYPEQQSWLQVEAERYSFEPAFPYHFLRGTS